MRPHCARHLLVFVLAAARLLQGQDSFDKIERVVAVGDVHGGFEEFVGILRMAGIIDGRNRWTGGKTHLVQLGDVVDRGPRSRDVLDLLIGLEPQARKAGGRVHALLGNHETMNIYGDLRYVSKEEYEAFRTPRSAELREQMLQNSLPEGGRPTAAERQKWESERPLGWVEHRIAFSAQGKYGRWLRERNAVVKINDSLFLHGGISPKYVATSIRTLNDAIRADLKDLSRIEGGIIPHPEGPLWYRGLAEEPEEKLATHVNQLLTNYGIARIVVAHTPQLRGITPRFNGTVILIDVGLSKLYGGPQQCLVLEGGRAAVLEGGRSKPLP